MADIPRAVLSEQFQERMQGKRLVSAVFLTFQFDAGFFEQEVLPVFLDVPLSHATAIRLVQIEAALRELQGNIAIYYDANGLVTGDAGSAKLDMKRIPVQHRKGIFHPKNAFLLVESEEANQEGAHARSLIIACMSANLTRSGWWENVECCHIEELVANDRTRLRDDLIAFLDLLRRKTPAEGEHLAICEVIGFLKGSEQRQQKSSSGRLLTHFYTGKESFPDFLDATAGALLRGTYMEVISPYFDDKADCQPLLDLIERFEPKEVRVFLPRSPSGDALVREELYSSVASLPNVQWGKFDRDMTKLGRSEDAGERMVHAKLYRFFTMSPKREICFVGSANLTSSAHRNGGNAESGFIVDIDLPRKPSFWLEPDKKQPTEFISRKEDEVVAASGGTKLNLRYHWNRKTVKVFWDASEPSPNLKIEARGVPVAAFEKLPPRSWTESPADVAIRVEAALHETSLFAVFGENDHQSFLLVQEEGMSHKPSLLMNLTAADILRYWSLLTPAQRTAFLESKLSELIGSGQGADLVARSQHVLDDNTLFDKLAGFFHAFNCLEQAVKNAIESGNLKEANYRLFGKKYDSLGNLLDKVGSSTESIDAVDRYVITMCARQICQEIARQFPDYWSQHHLDVRALKDRIKDLSSVRSEFAEQAGDMTSFLDWFDRWFLHRAEPKEVKHD